MTQGRPMPSSTFIYALIDPETGAERYIGKANNPLLRRKQHVNDARKKNSPVHQWIRSLNKQPIVVTLAEVPIHVWQIAERSFIMERGLKNLLNVSEGGNSPMMALDDEFRAEVARRKKIISADLRGGHITNEVRAKLRQLGFKWPELFKSWQKIPDLDFESNQRLVSRINGCA